MKFTPIVALVITSLATIAQSATAQVGAEGRMNFMRDARHSATGPQFENSRLQYGPLPVPGARSTAASGPLQAAERGDAKAQNQLGEMYAHGQGVPQNAAIYHSATRIAMPKTYDRKNMIGFTQNNSLPLRNKTDKKAVR